VKNWFLVSTFIFLAIADVSLGPVLVTWDGAGPDLLLLLSVYVALRAPWSVHPLLYFGLGTFSDLLVVPRPGFRGFTYLITALAIERLSPGRRRRNPLVFAVLCAAASLGVEMVYLVVATHGWPAGAGAGLNVVAKSAVMTGCAGLLLGLPANMIARLFGWPPTAAPLSRKQLMAAAAAGTARAPRRGRR
jgi:rod shape-determining protein MreD